LRVDGYLFAICYQVNRGHYDNVKGFKQPFIVPLFLLNTKPLPKKIGNAMRQYLKRGWGVQKQGY